MTSAQTRSGSRSGSDGAEARPVEHPRSGSSGSSRVGSSRADRDIPEATVARLPVYLRALTALTERNVASVSSEHLASAAGVNSAKLRKDLSYLGTYGTRGVGYDVEYLRYQIARQLGLTQDWSVVIVGIGNLGHALANYSGFGSRGFQIAGLVDSDPARVGEKVGDLEIAPLDALEDIVAEHRVSIGVIATPEANAQDVCDKLVGAGVRSILNFAPTVLTVPEQVDVRKVDLSIELQILAYHEQRKANTTPPTDPAQLVARQARVPASLARPTATLPSRDDGARPAVAEAGRP